MYPSRSFHIQFGLLMEFFMTSATIQIECTCGVTFGTRHKVYLMATTIFRGIIIVLTMSSIVATRTVIVKRDLVLTATC